MFSGVLEDVRRVVLGVAERFGLRVERIILLDSRVRGDFREDGD